MPNINEVLSIDLGDLTIAEVEVIEEVTGRSIMQVAEVLKDPHAPKGKLMRALAFVALRRKDPTATMEDAGNVRIEVGAEEMDPTDASGR